MSIKLRNRKTAEAQLGQFVEDISLPPKLISAIVDGEVSARIFTPRPKSHRSRHALLAQVNDAYVHYLVQLHTKIEFLATDPKVRVARCWRAARARNASKPLVCRPSRLLRCRTWKPRWSDCGSKLLPRRARCFCTPASKSFAHPQSVQVREFLLQRFYGLRKPKTNIQARRRMRRLALQNACA